jgi:hypothetical protein
MLIHARGGALTFILLLACCTLAAGAAAPAQAADGLPLAATETAAAQVQVVRQDVTDAVTVTDSAQHVVQGALAPVAPPAAKVVTEAKEAVGAVRERAETTANGSKPAASAEAQLADSAPAGATPARAATRRAPHPARSGRGHRHTTSADRHLRPGAPAARRQASGSPVAPQAAAPRHHVGNVPPAQTPPERRAPGLGGAGAAPTALIGALLCLLVAGCAVSRSDPRALLLTLCAPLRAAHCAPLEQPG